MSGLKNTIRGAALKSLALKHHETARKIISSTLDLTCRMFRAQQCSLYFVYGIPHPGHTEFKESEQMHLERVLHEQQLLQQTILS